MAANDYPMVRLANTAGDPVDPGGTPQAYRLLTNANATGSAVSNIRGGDYVWRIEGGTWNGATATLQYLGLDGSSWFPVRNAGNTADVTATANASTPVGIGQGATLRVAITGGPPSGLNSSLAGLS